MKGTRYRERTDCHLDDGLREADDEEAASTILKRLTLGSDDPNVVDDGIQVDGSGSMRNGITDIKALVKDLKKRFPDDEFVGVPNG